jgi:hypothetical protein
LLPGFLLVTALLHPSIALADPKNGAPYHIVVPNRALAAGEHIQLKLEPKPPEGVRVLWSVAGAGKGLVSAVYRAPYVIPVGTPPVRLGALLSGLRIGASTEIELIPGSVPEALDCLGPGQSFSTIIGDIEPQYTYADELPELIHKVEPEYPPSAFARGIEDTIPVAVLVCRSGRVLDAYVPLTFTHPGDAEPIERDPKLVDAALAAVRQYVFKPALVAGQPIATWVHTNVSFRR